MSFDKLTPRERHHVTRAYSQALYYAQRGFYDACRINASEIPPDVRSRLTGVVGQFLEQYVISELGYLVAGGEQDPSDGNTRITPVQITGEAL